MHTDLCNPFLQPNRITVLLLFIFSFVLLKNVHSQAILINEVMSSNGKTLIDENSDYPDWIELFNPGNASIDIAGWQLSDDPEQPDKWLFPKVAIGPRAFLLVFASGKSTNSVVVEWETTVQQGDSCRYVNVTEDLGNFWFNARYNDSSWQRGLTGIGYGDFDDATLVPTSAKCVYLRQNFSVKDADAVARMLLHMDFDDAFVAYINGIEVARANIGTVGIPPAYNLSASQAHEAEIYRGGSPLLFDLDDFRNALQTGQNLLAVEVHNYGNSSSDLSIIPFLSLGYSQSGLAERDIAPLVNLPNSSLHTNFKINAEGESLILSDAFGQFIDSCSVSSLPPDVSQGRYPDGGEDWYFFEESTPGSANNSNGYRDFSPQVISSHTPGFYENFIRITLESAEENTPVYYTLDGSVPTESSAKYQNQILLSRTLVVRARTFQAGNLPGPVLSQTYFIGEDTELPVISLSTDPANLWDWQTGIYVKGPNANSDYPYFNSNFWQDWEKPAHIEFFEDDKQHGFSIDCGIKIFGGWSRAADQKSLSLFFRAQYGTSTLEYPVFPDLKITNFEALVLRNSGNDWNYSMLRDGMMGSLVESLDIDKQAHRPAVLFINGEYWGIHNIREKINEHFLASHHGVDPDNVDLLEGNQNVIHGDGAGYQQLINYINTNDMSSDASQAFIEQQIELKSFLDYFIAQIYFDNTDWPGNNIKYWRTRGAEGKWRWILYDADFGFGLFDPNGYQHNTLQFALDPNHPDWPNPPWSTLLLRKFLENENLRNQFINYFADHLNLTFKAERVNAKIAAKRAAILPEINSHLKRWSHSHDNWVTQINRLYTFSQNRVTQSRRFLMQEFSFSSMTAVKVNLPDTTMGRVRINDHLFIEENFIGYYFPGIHISLQAVPRPGYRFNRWTGSDSSQNAFLQINPDKTINLTAWFEKSDTETPMALFNEINYNPSASFDSGDWVEIFNSGEDILDCSGWVFTDEDDSHRFVFPENTLLAAKAYLVLVSDKMKFTSLFPQVKNFIGETGFGLSGSGELLRLYDANGVLIDSLVYDDVPPWPTAPDGGGATLELTDPMANNSQAENWASSIGNGTPGASNSVTTEVKEQNQTQNQVAMQLEQNYPNPFSTNTTIVYRLPAAGDVTLKVYDIRGRLVETLLQGSQLAGTHKIIFDAHNVPSGIYYYRLTLGSTKSVTKKMIFIR
ncbi:CotH kinase family protein [candidate division KSB1 bacterium]|nr:CotH kinase family protein [candidate division KSB1 bacterium]